MSLTCTLPSCSSLCQLHPDRIRSHTLHRHQPAHEGSLRQTTILGQRLRVAERVTARPAKRSFRRHGGPQLSAVADGGRRLCFALYREVVGELVGGSSLLLRRFRFIATCSCPARILVGGEVRCPGRPATWNALVAAALGFKPSHGVPWGHASLFLWLLIEVAITSRFLIGGGLRHWFLSVRSTDPLVSHLQFAVE